MRQWATFFLVLTLLGAGQAWGAPGDPLWEQTFNYQSQYDITIPNAVAATSSIVIVTGEASTTTHQPAETEISLGFIRAYDAATGAFKWEGTPLTLASTPDAVNDNYLGDIMISGNIAMVTGMALSQSYSTSPPTVYLAKTIVRAYNISTGELLWENVKDGYGYLLGSHNFAANNRVFTTGTDKTAITPSCSTWVRAYQIPSATLSPLLLLE
jgi:hypothetical protein